MKKPSLILASASPRRRELLARLGLPFRVAASGVEEEPWPGEAPVSYALRNALDKAQAVQGSLRDGRAVIISADTIVVLGHRILEKPRDAADARRMLRALSGREHEVVTGLCVLRGRGSRRWLGGEAVRTTVRFRKLTAAEIRRYVESGEPMDKAGAYAIQGGAAGFVKSVRGSHSNVVGLPLTELRRILMAAGLADHRNGREFFTRR